MNSASLAASAFLLGCLTLTLLWSDDATASRIPYNMVLIPASTLQLGSTVDDLVFAVEECERSVRLKNDPTRCSPDEFSDELAAGPDTHIEAFFIDRTEVAQEDFARCVRAGRCSQLENHLPIEGLHGPKRPVTSVNAYDAEDYCRFIDARLPSEAEFEAASRGAVRRAYPWGSNFHRKRANGGVDGATNCDDADGFELLAPVDAYSSGSTPEGVLNLAGNAAEWTSSDFFPHGANGANGATERTVKGGSFTEPRYRLRGSARRGVPPHRSDPTIGFRCARSLVPHGGQITK